MGGRREIGEGGHVLSGMVTVKWIQATSILWLSMFYWLCDLAKLLNLPVHGMSFLVYKMCIAVLAPYSNWEEAVQLQS